MKKAVDSLMGPLERRVPVPAENRWIGAYPLACTLVLLIGLHGIFPQAELRMAGRTIDAAHESDSDIDPAAPAVAAAAAAKAKGRGKGKGKRKGKFQNIVDPTKEAEY